MYDTVKIGKNEILIDHDRYYVVSDWIKEKYNGREHTVPSLNKEISESEFKMLQRIEDRQRKLDRILIDVKPK